MPHQWPIHLPQRLDSPRLVADLCDHRVNAHDGLAIYDASGRQPGRIDGDLVYNSSSSQVGRIAPNLR